ncbi:MAG: c-type cytochrome [Rhodospirillaceae bacterium]|nr:c-type cytochrome [Rhodospirillaceae bacterium]
MRRRRAALAVAAMVAGLGVAVAVLGLWQPWRSPSPQDTAAVAQGRVLAQPCAVCHALDRGAAPRVGPPLWGVVGRTVGGVDGFGYSRALRTADGIWTPERLDHFLADPAAALPGTAMTFGGIADAGDRARVIAFLQTLSD